MAELTLAATQEVPVEETNTEIEAEKLDIEKLSPEEQAAVKEFSEKIDITNSEQVMNYGASAQQNISEFSDSALSTVKTKDMGEMGETLTNLLMELKGMKFKEKAKGIKGWFQKGAATVEQLKTQYEKAEVNVENIVEELEAHEVTLLKDISLMDKMYEKNEEYLKELTMYILAGKIKIDQLRNVELPEMQKKAEESGTTEDAQAASDFANLIGRFEKKINDLELTRMISIQMAPQIRMIQNNDSLMVEKIRSSINNTIPLWKNQMVLALSMFHSETAMKAQNQVTEVTNQLLKDNAEKLHQSSVSIAQEAERGVVDLETLQQTNRELISMLDEVKQIQDNGRAKRAAAEEELAKIEGELKAKLLSIKG